MAVAVLHRQVLWAVAAAALCVLGRGTRVGIAELETHLGYWLRRVSNAVSGEFGRSLRARGTSVAEWVLLRQLYERESATPGEMAETLSMTRAGRRVLPALAGIADENDTRFFACLDAGERSALRHLLGKIAAQHQIRNVPVE